MRFRFVAENAVTWPVSVQCRVLEVSTSGYYEWLRKPHTERDERDIAHMAVIRCIFDDYYGIYGSPRIGAEMRDRGYEITNKQVARLMKDMGLKAIQEKRFKPPQTTDSTHGLPVAKNLLNQDFYAERANQKWVGDITYIATNEGWLYLATVIDLYSRKVVGWAFSDSLATPLVSSALSMAVRERRPQGPLIFHSDQGCQYASHEFCDLLKVHGIQQSMSRKGCCYDNAVAESFFHSLKVEWISGHRYASRRQAQSSVFTFIQGFYNRMRRHSTLGYLSPIEFEERHGTEQAA